MMKKEKFYELLGKITFAGILAIGGIVAIFATGGLILIPLALGMPLFIGIGIGKKVAGKNA